MRILFFSLFNCDWPCNDDSSAVDNKYIINTIPSLLDLCVAAVVRENKNKNKNNNKEWINKLSTLPKNLEQYINEWANTFACREIHLQYSNREENLPPWIAGMGQYYAKCLYPIIFNNMISEIAQSCASYSRHYLYTIRPNFFLKDNNQREKYLEQNTKRNTSNKTVFDDEILVQEEREKFYTRVYITRGQEYRFALCVYSLEPQEETQSTTNRRVADLFLYFAYKKCFSQQKKLEKLDNLLFAFNSHMKPLQKQVSLSFKGEYGLDPIDSERESKKVKKIIFPSRSTPLSSLSSRLPHDPLIIPSTLLSLSPSLFSTFIPSASPSFLSSLLPSFFPPPLFARVEEHKWGDMKDILEKENPGIYFPSAQTTLVNGAVMGPITTASVMELRDDVIIGSLRVPVKEIGGIANLGDALLEAKALKTFHHIAAKWSKTQVNMCDHKGKEKIHKCEDVVHYAAVEEFYTSRRCERKYTFCIKVNNINNNNNNNNNNNQKYDISVGPSSVPFPAVFPLFASSSDPPITFSNIFNSFRGNA